MNLLITGAWNNAVEYIPELEQMGYSVCFQQHEKDALSCSCDWAEGIVCNGLFLSHPIEKFTNLRYIQLTSAGFDRVPMGYVQEKNIEIYNARGVYSIPMAEFAVSGVLQLYKHAPFFYKNQSQSRWEKHRGLIELYGKTVCIIGCGSVGTECAKRFRAFGCRVIGIDLFPKEDENYAQIVDLQQLETMIPKADILVLTLPLTDDTRHLMNEQRFALMKEKAVLVNISRGAVVDTRALVRAMNRLCGAVLDVFEEEPLEDSSPLWKMRNVFITPHNSFVGDNNARRLDAAIMDALRGRMKTE